MDANLKALTLDASSVDTSALPKEDSYSEHFPLYARADLVVRSSDGILFATQRCFLQAASAVFEDTLEMGTEGEQRDGRPVLQLSEEADDLAIMLAQMRREPVQAHQYEGADGLILALRHLVRLSYLVEKYAVSTTVIASFVQQRAGLLINAYADSENFNGQDGIDEAEFTKLTYDLLGVGLIHSIPLLAVLGLSAIIGQPIECEGHSVLAHDDEERPDKRSDGFRYPGVEDLTSELLARIPSDNLRAFASVMSKYSNKVGYSPQLGWKELYDVVEVRSSSLQVLRRV
jgi:hypothetical protein